MSLARFLNSQLQQVSAANRYRKRRVVTGGHGVDIVADGRACINFCSNDYLGLAAHPEVVAALAKAANETGSGSGASQLVTGYNAEHAALEEEVADFLGRERALLFATGYAANMGVISALMRRGDTIVCDALNHASLIDGARLSGAAKRIYEHVNMRAARQQLASADGGNTLLLSDAVFSMDGDAAPAGALAALASEHDAWLMLDDAHGLGVLGPQGQGSVAAAGLDATRVPILVATLGKSVGAAGAFVAGDQALIEYLIQAACPFIFSTAPPPAVAAAARKGLRLMQHEPWRREHLFALIERMQTGAAQRRLPLSPSSTPIQPLILGDEARALAVSNALLERGFLVTAIRPPTVPQGSARLRITLTAGHSVEQVDALLDCLAEIISDTVSTVDVA